MNAVENLSIIRQNIQAELLDATGAPDQIFALMQPDGSFSDLDYSDQNWTTWQPGTHMKRAADLCSMYACPENAHYRSVDIAEAVHRLIAFYVAGQFVSDNWWWNDVGIPNDFLDILLLFRDELSEEEYAQAAHFARGNPKRPRLIAIPEGAAPDTLRFTSSQVDYSIRHLAAVEPDAERAAGLIAIYLQVLSRVLTENVYASGRSPEHLYYQEHVVKSDYSYHEHENALLPNSYGDYYVGMVAQIVRLLKGSDFRLSEAACREVARLLLLGFRYMRYHGVSPMMICGRNVGSYETQSLFSQAAMNNTIELCDMLLAGSGAEKYARELAVLREAALHPHEGEHFDGTRYFWHSDFLSHNRRNYQFTVHGVSNRVKRPESILKKNLQGMFLGDGSYNLLLNGYEYNAIAPCMDWRKIPGTTANQGAKDLNPECEIDTQIDTDRIFGGAKGTTAFVGGVSDGAYGLFAMDYDHLNVKAKKAWFCFEEGVVCLGAGITGEGDAGVFTTLDQRRTDGNVISGENYVLADNIGYLFLEKAEHVLLENGERTGAWNLVDQDSGTDDPVTAKMLLMGIDHGVHPLNARYAYLLLPHANTQAMEEWEKNPPLAVIRNDGDAQAVYQARTRCLQAVFYRAGSVEAGGICLTADAPCALMLRFAEAGIWRLWLSNPAHETAEITVTLSGAAQGTMTFHLEEGERFNDLGRPLCFDSQQGFLPHSGAKGDAHEFYLQ